MPENYMSIDNLLFYVASNGDKILVGEIEEVANDVPEGEFRELDGQLYVFNCPETGLRLFRCSPIKERAGSLKRKEV